MRIADVCLFSFAIGGWIVIIFRRRIGRVLSAMPDWLYGIFVLIFIFAIWLYFHNLKHTEELQAKFDVPWMFVSNEKVVYPPKWGSIEREKDIYVEDANNPAVLDQLGPFFCLRGGDQDDEMFYSEQDVFWCQKWRYWKIPEPFDNSLPNTLSPEYFRRTVTPDSITMDNKVSRKTYYTINRKKQTTLTSPSDEAEKIAKTDGWGLIWIDNATQDDVRVLLHQVNESVVKKAKDPTLPLSTEDNRITLFNKVEVKANHMMMIPYKRGFYQLTIENIPDEVVLDTRLCFLSQVSLGGCFYIYNVKESNRYELLHRTYKTAD